MDQPIGGPAGDAAGDERADGIVQEPTQPGRGARVAAAADVAWRALVDAFGVWEWIVAAGVGMLLLGLLVWFGAGPAFAGVGALVIWMGIAGGRAAALAAVGEVPPVDEDRAGPSPAEVAA